MSCLLKAEINVKNLKENALAVKRLIGNKVKLSAVVKGNAYGHGLVGVSSSLYPLVDSYCVSMEDEALSLRISGIDKEVILLTPAFSVERLVKNGITLTVSSKAEVISVVKACEKLGVSASVHIKLNTGMNRLGASSAFEVNEIISAVKDTGVSITGALSHLGAVNNKRYLSSQYQNFLRLSDGVKNYNDKACLHLSSSAGALLGEKYLFSMVRVGIMLYGYTPINTDKINLKKVMTVYAKNLGEKTLKNQRFLYGDKRRTESAVTLIRMGYADGFFRSLGEISPLCMDISGVRGENTSEYVPVMVDAIEISKKLKTIPYEILTSVTKRAEFSYLE